MKGIGDLSDRIDAVKKRYDARESARAGYLDAVHERGILAGDTPERVQRRLERLGIPSLAAEAMIVGAAPPAGAAAAGAATAGTPTARPSAGLPRVGLERIIGRPDFNNVAFLTKALRISRTVGRVIVNDASGNLRGYGTGFMVSPHIMITNQHVLESRAETARSKIEFNYQVGLDGTMQHSVLFDLDPDTFFLQDQHLDFTLTAVRPPEARGWELAFVGWSRLLADPAKVINHERLNIIQHPGGKPKQVVIRENDLVDVLPAFLHYATDTMPGSSGSPVFNDQWEVVALHHLGVPRTDASGNYLTRSGKVWDPSTMTEDEIDWECNEGARISRIVAAIEAAPLGSDQRALRREMLESQPFSEPIPSWPTSHVAAVSQNEGFSVPEHAGARLNPDGSASWTIPLRVSMRVGEGPSVTQGPPDKAAAAGPAETPPAPSVSGEVHAEELALSHYTGKGYDPSFLATKVPLPDAGYWKKDLAPLKQGDGHELRYRHFSVVVAKSRRLALYTAVNIDGKALKALKRGADRWLYDPRIDRQYQSGPELYSHNPLDRGHLVRRLDPVWGDDADEADVDTFHFTNCSPQHKELNRDTWVALEDYVLQNAAVHDLKVTVFTGPVFRADDQVYRSRFQIPVEYWKVVAIVKDDGKLSATAYLETQKRLVQDLEFAYGPFRTYQVKVALIENMTGLRFGDLHKSDPLLAEEAFTSGEIRSAADLRL